MASNETNSPLEVISAAVRAATKLTQDTEPSEKLTPAMLASAIKLAALSTDHQEQLTPANINAAIKVSKKKDNEDHLTPASLAMALKLATKASSYDDNDTKDTDDVSVDQMLAAMKAAIAITQKDHSDELATSEMLSDALKLAQN